MIMKMKFLFLILLCWPFVSMAVDTQPIQNATTVKDAVSATQTATKDMNLTDTQKAQLDAAIKDAEKEPQCDPQEQKTPETPATPTKTEPVAGQNCPDDTTGTYPNCTCTDEDKRYDSSKNACVDDELKKKQKAYDEAHEKEQSTANKTLTALTTAATGIGGMELAMGLAEQTADKNASADMDAYIATFRCTYANGQQVKGGPDEIELPGANNQQMMNLRAQYISLAADLKERKAALDMAPGIESKEILDKSQMGLYDDENIGITGGAYESLYRAKALGSETDQAKIDEMAEASKKRVMGGAIAAGAGAVVGVLGDSMINGELGKKLKQAIAEKKAGKETQKLLKAEAAALKDIQKCLKSAGVKDAEKLSFSEFFPSVLSFKSVKCDASLIAQGNQTTPAHELIYDSVNEAVIYNHLTTAFGPENTGKIIGYTLPAEPDDSQITAAKTKIKNSIESVQQKFKDAEEKDKESAEKAGISIGNISGSADGGGLSSVASLFGGFATDSKLDLSSF